MTFKTLYTFGSSTTSVQSSPLIDASGDVIFETSTNLLTQNPTFSVFELTKSTSGLASTPVSLGTFTGQTEGLALDGQGNLLVLNIKTGSDIAELAKTGTGYGQAADILDFNSAAAPTLLYPTSVQTDSSGDIFGFGASLTGVAGSFFELAKTANGYASNITDLVDFPATSGGAVGMTMDAQGNIFGVLLTSGNTNGGSVFEIAKTANGYATSMTTLYTAADGSGLSSHIAMDTAGDVFGVTYSGGANDKGAIFEIAKTTSGYAAETTLYSFTGNADGRGPGYVVVDAAGDLFGITSPVGHDAQVWELAKTSTGYASSLTILHDFGTDTLQNLTMGADGNLYGTSTAGVFEITLGTPFTGGSATSAVTAWQSGNIAGPVAISDSAANISAGLDTLQAIAAAGDATSITVTGSGFQAITLTAAQLTADAQALAKLGGDFYLTITATPGSDATISGLSVGYGDVVAFGNAASSYSLTASGDGAHFTVSSGGATDSLSGITALQFKDVTLFVASETPAVAGAVSSAQVTDLYAAVFARTPDVPGLAYYEAQAAANPTLAITTIAQNFLSSPEYTGNSAHNYAQTSAGDAQFITDTYTNLLHRAPAASDVAWYQANVITPILGSATPGTAAYTQAELAAHAAIVADFSQSSEFIGDVKVTSATPASSSHWLLLI